VNPDGTTVTLTFRGVSVGPFRTGNGVTLAIFAGVAAQITGLEVPEHGTVLADICAALAP